jgi:hypothetical protein
MTPDLFSPVIQRGDSIIPRARNNDALTSHEAAFHALTFAKHYRARILAVLIRPMTIYDIAEQTGLDHVQIARRMPELQTMGLARPTGATERGRTGGMCRLWEKV